MRYHLFSLCIPVRGYLRAIIYDLQKDDYYFVPSEIEQILKNNKRSELMNHFLSNLVKNEIIFGYEQKEKPALFNALDPTLFDYPSTISNSIIELQATTHLNKIFNIINELNCFNVHFVFTELSKKAKEFILTVIDFIKSSIIKHCEFVFSYNNYLDFIGIFQNLSFPELSYVFVYRAPTLKPILKKKNFPKVYFDINNHSYCNEQNKKSIHIFSINTFLYSESLNYNNYYNRKLFISKQGEIKNGPLTEDVFGNIYHDAISLNEIIENEKFKQLWKVKKDVISVCNVCEFRYMCVDSRIPKKHTENDNWYFTSECNYNPFIAKWQNEDGYLSLAECGIEIKERAISIDYGILNKIISGLYDIKADKE